jgi:hypothetical protein
MTSPEPSFNGGLHEPGPEAVFPDDLPVPYTLTPQVAALRADEFFGRRPGTAFRLLGGALPPDPEATFEEAAEVLDEWDSADSNAYQARVEAGLEPEAGL